MDYDPFGLKKPSLYRDMLLARETDPGADFAQSHAYQAVSPGIFAWEREPEKYQGEARGTSAGESRYPPTLRLEDSANRPVDRYQQAQAETLSPTMGGYGLGTAIGETAAHASEGDWKGAAASSLPLWAMALPMPGMKGVPKVARELDQRGFYSPSLEAAKTLGQDTGTVQQFRSMILKNGGKPKELEAIGFDKAFPDPQAKVSRQQIEEFLRGNRVGLGEIVYGQFTPEQKAQQQARERQIEQMAKEVDELYGRGRIDEANALSERLSALEREVDRSYHGGPKYDIHSTPGGIPGSYREVVTTLPQESGWKVVEHPEVAGQYALRNAAGDYAKLPQDRSRIAGWTRPEMAAEHAETQHYNPNSYTSSHWPGITNPLLHYRTKDFEITPTSARPPAMEKVTPSQEQGRGDLGSRANQPGALTEPTKVRVLDELQSDWAQRARDQGTRDPAAVADLKQRQQAALDASRAIYEEAVPRFGIEPSGATRTYQAQREIEKSIQRVAGNLSGKETPENIARAQEMLGELQRHQGIYSDVTNKLNAAESGVPSAPYISSTSDWVDLGLKQALLDAAKDPSVSRFAWAPGTTQAKRYSLGHQIDNISVVPGRGEAGKGIHGPDGDRVSYDYSFWPKSKGGSWDLGALRTDAAGKIVHADRRWGDVIGKDVREVIGRDAAEKGLAMKEEGKLSGLDLEVGGEGMKSFYGDFTPDGSYTPGIVGTRLLKLLKSLDPEAAKIETYRPRIVEVQEKPYSAGGALAGEYVVGSDVVSARMFDTREEALAYAESVSPTYPSIPITPAMRKKIEEEGFPLFNLTGAGGLLAWELMKRYGLTEEDMDDAGGI